ncbi:hypothetical protein ACSBR2_021029 [Camellia fascicularis]
MLQNLVQLARLVAILSTKRLTLRIPRQPAWSLNSMNLKTFEEKYPFKGHESTLGNSSIKYTWCNSIARDKWSRIDRVLVDPKWLEVFNLKLWGLPRLISDHCPLLLMEDERDWGPKPFRIINAWSLHPCFPAFVEKTWKEAEVEGWAGFVLLKKLKILKFELKAWHKEVFGSVNVKLKEAEEKLHFLDLAAESRDLDEAERTRRRIVRD